jgi:peptidoglycan DL-endopeptidase LytE
MMNRRNCHWMVLLVVLFLPLLSAKDSFARETYRVKRGDTLAEISRTFHVSVHDLRDANHLRGNTLKPRTILTIPGSDKNRRTASIAARDQRSTPTSPSTVRHYTVKRGETLASLAAANHVSTREIKRLNRLWSNRLRTGQKIALPTAAPPAVARLDRASEDGDDAASAESGEEPGDGDAIDELPPVMDDEKTTGSKLLGTWDTFMERQLLVKVAQGFIGAPYRLGGSTVRGIDCSGFVKKVYDIFNVMLPRTAHEQSGVGQYVSRSELEEGDLVFFHTRQVIGHVGIYIGNGKFVHASSGRERMVRVNSLNEPYYSNRYVKAVRVKGMEGI